MSKLFVELGHRDLMHLSETIQRAVAAAAEGRSPFAARLVSADQRVVIEAVNTVHDHGDVTAHAEINLLRRISGLAAEVISGATLYASTEPCAMCAAAICWSRIGRVVYGLSHLDMRRLRPNHGREPNLLGRQVFDVTKGAPELIGPVPSVDPHRPFMQSSVRNKP